MKLVQTVAVEAVTRDAQTVEAQLVEGLKCPEPQVGATGAEWLAE